MNDDYTNAGGWISIHAPREGRDGLIGETCQKCLAFQSTRPARGATEADCKPENHMSISIHAPREGRDKTKALSG